MYINLVLSVVCMGVKLGVSLKKQKLRVFMRIVDRRVFRHENV